MFGQIKLCMYEMSVKCVRNSFLLSWLRRRWNLSFTAVILNDEFLNNEEDLGGTCISRWNGMSEGRYKAGKFPFQSISIHCC